MSVRTLTGASFILVCSLHAQAKLLTATYTATPITVDGVRESVWDQAEPSPIAICKLTSCPVSGTVQALWNGPVLYLLFNVTDADVKPSSGVQIFVDQFDDKHPKFEEDDGSITITAADQQTGNRANANLPYYPPFWTTHLKSHAAARNETGYTVEVAWLIGDRPLKNGTKIGMEFLINVPGPPAYQLFWSSANHKGLNDNTIWGDVLLAGYDGKSPMPLNAFMLDQNIHKAEALVKGIWKDESRIDPALTTAKGPLKTQPEIDAANTNLDAALRGLRRAGKYADPFDLPELKTLPDPFTFRDGSKVKSAGDWEKRRTEIRDVAQYYEFGYMPPPPQSLTATIGQPGSITVTVQDHGRTATFSPVLTLPSSGTAPYPVVVEESFRAQAPPNRAFLQAGYAVLTIPTYSVASDDANHTGAFFTLYPYQLDREGNDRGVLLAWAWGASRGVDALQYLAAHDPEQAKLLDLNKLVVTGFSRWGKAALLAGFLDDRFQVTAPGGSGSGGAAPYRYDSFGNEYPWGRSNGAETLGDHVRHQTHNSNEMIRRFLNDRMYQKSGGWGYGTRLPFDHHEMIAAIAPRAVIVINTNDDYADCAEGDAIGYEGAKPVYQLLGVPQKLALDIFMGGGGHSLKPSQAADIVKFADFILFGKAMPDDVKSHLTTHPYLDAGTYDRYYGGLKTMMPWAAINQSR
jgi:endo-1,4-beta-xylanase